MRGGGHDEGLHLVIIAGCVISATWLGEWCARGVCVFVCVGVCVVKGRVITERSTSNKFAVW